MVLGYTHTGADLELFSELDAPFFIPFLPLICYKMLSLAYLTESEKVCFDLRFIVSVIS